MMVDSTGAGGTLRDDELIMAVVEAARECGKIWGRATVTDPMPEFARLLRALEALEREEVSDG